VLRDAAAFGAWLATIARNRATDFARRSHEAIELESAERIPDEESIERRTDVYGLDARTALDAIRSLPLAYRETLVLRPAPAARGTESRRWPARRESRATPSRSTAG
jgi:RNA polymerase sigma-70 factor, ECF subfamily